MKTIPIEEDETLLDIMHSAYSAGWCEGYKEKGVEFDWIDEGFAEYVRKLRERRA